MSNINLKKQFKDFFNAKLGREKSYEIDDLKHRVYKCNLLFDELHECVKKHGWNDNHCQVTIRPVYDRCIIKRDKIRTQLLERGLIDGDEEF